MSNEELYQSITDICFENGGVTKPMADKLLQLLKQHREAYALEENKNGFFAACGVCGVENLENVEQYYQMYRAELREKVGRDHNK